MSRQRLADRVGGLSAVAQKISGTTAGDTPPEHFRCAVGLAVSGATEYCRKFSIQRLQHRRAAETQAVERAGNLRGLCLVAIPYPAASAVALSRVTRFFLTVAANVFRIEMLGHVPRSVDAASPRSASASTRHETSRCAL